MPTAAPPRPLLAAFALLALLAPGALAQEPDPSAPALQAKVEPASVDLRPGASVNATFAVSNGRDRGVTLTLGGDARDLKIVFAQPELSVPAHETARVRVEIRAPPEAPPGERILTLVAEDARQATTQDADTGAVVAKAPLTVRVLPALSSAAGAPRVSPEGLQVVARPGASAVGHFKVENPSPETRRYELRFDLPPGWTATADVSPVEVPARSARPVNVTFAAARDAKDGEAIVMVGSTAADVVKLPVFLAVVRPELTFRVDPEEVELPVGGRVVATLLVTNSVRSPLEPRFELALPEGVNGSLAEATVRVPPGATVSIPLVLEATGALVEGDVVRAAVHRVPPSQDGASALPKEPGAGFRIRMVAAPAASGAVEEMTEGGLGAAGLVVVGAVGVGGGAGVVAWLHRRWPLALVGLYTRLLPSSVLTQPLRERIAQAVRERPGIPFGELKRALGMGSGTLTHHARVLEDAGVLFSTTDGQARRFYLVGHGRVEATPPLDERALQTLRERGPMSASDLARALGVSRQSLHYHLKRMLQEGRLQGGPRGRELWVEAPPA